MDGLVVEATAIHAAYPDYLGKEIRNRIDELGNVFMSEYFTPIKSIQHRDEVLNMREPAIIMATSGMLEGGPILTYLREFAPDDRNILIFVSYQVEGTLGRKLLKGLREFHLVGEGGKTELVNVKLKIVKVDGFSGHSSRQQLLGYLRAFQPKPRNLILVHGEYEAVMSLARSASKTVSYTHLTLPTTERV